MAYTYAGRWGPEAPLDANGSLQKNTAVNVYQVGTTTQATTYSDETKTHTTSALSTDSVGNFTFWADPGDYDVQIGTGTPVTVSVLERPAETENLSNKGQPNGYAGLDGDGKVPVTQLPDAALTGGSGGGGSSAMSGDIAGTTDNNFIVTGIKTKINNAEQVTSKNSANGYAGLDGSGFLSSSVVPPLPESKITNLDEDLAAKEDKSARGQNNGYAPLDSSGKVPTINLPASGIAYVPGGTSDDTAAVQNYLTNMPNGTDAVFQPGVVYTLSAPVQYKGGCRFIAPGHEMGNYAAIIQQKAGSNIVSGSSNAISGLFVPAGWWSNATSADAAVSFFNLVFDVNQSNNSSTTAAGVVLMNGLSVVGHCFFKNGGTNPGLYLADKTRNNTTLTTVPTEPHIYGNRFDSNAGLFVQNSTTNAYVDGIAVDNSFNALTGSGIRMDKMQGWRIAFNRIFAAGNNGITGNNVTNSVVTGNLISNFGTNNVASAFYQGIGLTVLNGMGVTVTENKILCSEPSGSATFQYLSVSAAASNASTYAVLTDNELHGVGTANALGLLLQNGSGGVLNYTSSNIVVGFASGKQTYIQSAGTGEVVVTPV
jgi:hypothetical protein